MQWFRSIIHRLYSMWFRSTQSLLWRKQFAVDCFRRPLCQSTKYFSLFCLFIFFFTSAYCSWSHWKKTILRGGDGCEQTRVFKRPSGHLLCRSMWKTSTIFSRAPASTRWKPAMEWRLFFFGWGGGILTTFRENEVESLKKNANTVTRRCH